MCGSRHLVPVIDLGFQYLQGSFIKPGMPAPPLRQLPTELVRCDVTQDENACGLLQLAHTFPPEILYANYWYRSGTNATMRDHLKGIVDSAMQILNNEAPTVLDIGCNDGTLLGNYPKRARKYGVDPSDIAREIGGDTVVINTVFPSGQSTAALPQAGFDVVTSIAMFYDLESPVAFAQEIKKLLKPNGLWILEMSYLPMMLQQNSFDTICHEHLEYYSLSVLEIIMARAGLRVFRVELNDVNGGSIRCYVCHAENQTLSTPDEGARLHSLRTIEFEMELDTDTPYIAFQNRIKRLKDDLNSMLFQIRAAGQRVHIYGASTKGNVLLQWYGINRMIVEAAADRNPSKAGARTLGTDIPIISEEDSRAMKPDYYLVLPWHFRTEFLQRERKMIEAGTKFIFPLPELEVVGIDNLEEALAKPPYDDLFREPAKRPA